MTARLVVDARVALKWVLSPLNEPLSDRAADILQAARSGAVELVQPPHWAAEIVAVVARQEPERLADTIEILFGLDASCDVGRSTYLHAARLSVLFAHHLFDTLYHAVALEMEATLVTADARYFAKAEALGGIRMLGAWTG